jgi:hypothetical protein
VLRTFGAALHKTFHARDTKRWVNERDAELGNAVDPAERQLAADRRRLEEPRMEAHGCRDFASGSVRGRFTLRALDEALPADNSPLGDPQARFAATDLLREVLEGA